MFRMTILNPIHLRTIICIKIGITLHKALYSHILTDSSCLPSKWTSQSNGGRKDKYYPSFTNGDSTHRGSGDLPKRTQTILAELGTEPSSWIPDQSPNNKTKLLSSPGPKYKHKGTCRKRMAGF